MEENTTLSLEPFTPAHAHFLAHVSDDEFWSHAAAMALQSPIQKNGGHSSSGYMLCELVQGHCLLPLASLQEVIAAPARVTQLPMAPSWVVGLIAWRDEAIIVIDLASYLFHSPLLQLLSSQSIVDESLIAFVSYGATTLGLLVSSIDTVTTLASTNSEVAVSVLEQVQDREAVMDVYQGALLLNMEILVTHITQRIEMMSANG